MDELKDLNQAGNRDVETKYDQTVNLVQSGQLGENIIQRAVYIATIYLIDQFLTNLSLKAGGQSEKQELPGLVASPSSADLIDPLVLRIILYHQLLYKTQYLWQDAL